MRYLLIDFGASFIKVASYDSVSKEIKNLETLDSPFQKKYQIQALEIEKILKSIVDKNSPADGIMCCSILGGSYHDQLYYSWKDNPYKENQTCVISGVFYNSPNYHVHSHFSENGSKEIKILGHVNSVPVFSCLGDTNCVIESLSLDSKNLCINIGTGSQIIYLNNDEIKVHKFIPAGRALLTFQKFFASIGVDFFNLINNTSFNDVIFSDLKVDLNVFKQSHQYSTGGNILGIKEENFCINNLTGSILKSLVLQYEKYITKSGKQQILLTGGVPKKIKILPDLFRHFYPCFEISVLSGEIESTHLGMAKYIDKHL